MSSVGLVSAGNDPVADLAYQIRSGEQRRVQTFAARTADVAKETIDEARYTGDLRTNQNRLNVFTMLSRGDRVDHFRFNVTIGGKVRLGFLVDELDRDRKVLEETPPPDVLRFRLIQVRGNAKTVVADSDPESGAAYERFLRLNGTGLDLRRDKYVIEVSRSDKASDTEYFYSFQLAGRRYYQDYDTQEAEAPARAKAAAPYAVAEPEPFWLGQFVNQLF